MKKRVKEFPGDSPETKNMRAKSRNIRQAIQDAVFEKYGYDFSMHSGKLGACHKTNYLIAIWRRLYRWENRRPDFGSSRSQKTLNDAINGYQFWISQILDEMPNVAAFRAKIQAVGYNHSAEESFPE